MVDAGHDDVVAAGDLLGFAAYTTLFRRPVGPVSYDCVKIIVVRDGSAMLFGELGRRLVKAGDVVLLAENALVGSEPEGSVTCTTIYLDPDYLVDLIRWQHAAFLQDRLDAQAYAEKLYSEPNQILRLGEACVESFASELDELVTLSEDGGFAQHFVRMQTLWFSIAQVITPHVRVSPAPPPRTPAGGVADGWRPVPRPHTRGTLPRGRRLVPVRAEMRRAVSLLRADPGRRWTRELLAEEVHLSVSQLSRLFLDAYGKTPLAYLTVIRAEQLARLLRETNLPIASAMRQVGWHSRGHGARLFRQLVDMSPGEYRRLRAQPYERRIVGSRSE